MNTPFSAFGEHFAGGPRPGGPDFGFAPRDRHALHEAKRQAKREFFEQLRDHGAGPRGPFGFDPGFARGFGPGFGFGPGRRGPGRGHRGRRGDVRAAILVLLTDRPMHGYEMIQEIAERSQDLWRPSPGSVYPTLQLLVDEGLIVGSKSDGSKKLFQLTEEGRAAAEQVENPPWQEIADGADPEQVSLRKAVGQLLGAVAQSAHAASTEQQRRIADIINNARREVYSILGEAD